MGRLKEYKNINIDVEPFLSIMAIVLKLISLILVVIVMRIAVNKKGLRVESVTAGSPAAKAGLKANDVILKIDSQSMASLDDLGNFLKARRPGTQISVHLQRGGEMMTIAVVLGKRAN